ncbi:polysaccharide deacetylase family protein [Yinghuangia soli]|uniref:Polysaccharide deacetylase family protein n=1 Tax=Yinghuangia soli TaxID=2908204 RepID=A0AA41Q455_9ACTN|nr:polysaccharide deacetylase family protein [Yinghuangia soli]MCF2530094.1 polysaccharide deacetylase family protein [Yinghuangia soli]
MRTAVRSRLGVVAAVVLALAVSACGGADEPGPFGSGTPHGLDVPGTASAENPNGAGSQGGSGAPAPGDAAAAAARWGLEPLRAAPPAPAVKPVKADPAAPPVVKRIPTDQKIVFVTIDDGAEKDPKFVEMMRDLKVPFTMFLNDTYVRQDPGYFRKLQELGNSVQNHTLDHPNMVKLGPDAQKREICGNSDRIEAEYGTRPYLFRPPFGNYNSTTVQAAGGCGVGAIILWREAMQIGDMQYVDADKTLKPGDVILAHFRGPSDLKGKTMTQMMANLLRKIQAQGFAVARLEDYV